jgi:GGDEF domain-containing protein
VDKFKAINDTHGHDAGDRALCTLAARLERWDGDLCTVARFGGEEFGLMISGLTGPALAQFAERVREGWPNATMARRWAGSRSASAWPMPPPPPIFRRSTAWRTKRFTKPSDRGATGW